MWHRDKALALLVVLAWPAVAAGQGGPGARHHAGRISARSPSPDVAAMERTIAAQADSGFSGVVLVAQGDAVLLRRAYGSGVLPGSAFWIGSMTKGFTAAAVLRLVGSGRISFDDSIAALLPRAPGEKSGIRVRHLLTHTAGLAGSYSGGGERGGGAALRAILSAPLEHPPGTTYRYSDDDFELLAAIIEAVSGRSWESYVQDEVLAPAGLRRTGFWCVRAPSVPPPVGGADGSRVSCGGQGHSEDDWGHKGANGMSSTADDLLRWSRFLGRGERLPGLAQPLLESPRVHVRREDERDVEYGSGVRIYERDGRVVEVLHSGAADDGHSGIVRVLSSGLTIVVLSNAGRHDGTTWSSHVASLLAPRG